MSNLNDRLNDIFRNEAYEPMDDDALVAAVTRRASGRRARFNGLFALALVAVAGLAMFAARMTPMDSDPAGPTPSPTQDELTLLTQVTFDYDDLLGQLDGAFTAPQCGDRVSLAPAQSHGLTLRLEQSGRWNEFGGLPFVAEASVEAGADAPDVALTQLGGVVVVRDGVVVQVEPAPRELWTQDLVAGGSTPPDDVLLGGIGVCGGAELPPGEYEAYAWMSAAVGPAAAAARSLEDSGLEALSELGADGGLGTTQSELPPQLAEYCTFWYAPADDSYDGSNDIESTVAPDWDTRAHPELGYLVDMKCDIPADVRADFTTVAIPEPSPSETAVFVLISEPLTFLRD